MVKTRCLIAWMGLLVAAWLVASSATLAAPGESPALVALGESPEAVAPGDYIIAEGDSLFIIAAKLLGDGARYAAIIALTNARHALDPSYPLIESPTRIRVGWKLAIPDGRYDPSTAILAGQPITDTLSADAKPLGVLKALTKVDDLTFKMTFYERPAALLAKLATPMMAIHSPTAIRKWGKDYLYYPVGTGPYTFREWLPGEQVTLDANPDYWGGAPQIKRLIYRAVSDPAARLAELRAMTATLAYDLSPITVTTDAITEPVAYQAPPLAISYLAINQDWADAAGNKPLKDVRVRQAIAHAINKQTLLSAYRPNLAIAAKEFIPPMMWGYNDAFPDYNYSPSRARELLAEAGYPQGFTTTLWVMNTSRSYLPDPLAVAQAVQADLRAAGIEARIVKRDWEPYLEAVLRKGEHGLCLLGWTPYLADADNILFTLFSGVDKQFGQSAPDGMLADYLQRARAETDQPNREALYREVNAIVHGLVPGVPLAHVGVTVVGAPTLLGYVPSPLWDRWHLTSTITARPALTIAQANDAQGLDIADEVDAESLRIGAQLFDSLIALDPATLRPQPHLAERWEVSADGLEWTFYLRPGVSFHDGTPLNADAVIFNLHRMWDKQHPYRAGHTHSFYYFYYFFGGFRGEEKLETLPES